MQEILKVKQDSPYLRKRWFNSAEVDLFVWLDNDNVIERFQLCYDKFINEHAFTWSKHNGYNHYIVSDGEDSDFFSKTSPILIEKYQKKVFPKSRLMELLKAHQNIDILLFNDIMDKVSACPFEQIWHLYIIRSDDGALYTGITTNIERRLLEHQSNSTKSAKYFRGKTGLQLVFQYELESRSLALSLEAKVKNLSKAKKEKLVCGETNIMQLISVGK